MVPRSSPPTTYGAALAAAAIVGLAAGFGLLAAGAATSVVRPRGSVAVVTALLGVAWLANDWIGWDEGPALARSLATVAVPVLVPLIVHLTLAYPAGRVRGNAAWTLLGVVYGATAVTSIGHALFRDPFLDLGCWSNCSDNSFLVRNDSDLVRLLDGFWLATVTAAAVVTVSATAIRLAHATNVARRAMWPVLVPAVVAAVASAMHAWLVDDRTEDPTTSAFRALFFLHAIALLGIAAGVAWGLLACRSHQAFGHAVGRRPRVDADARIARTGARPLARRQQPHRRLLASELAALRRRLRSPTRTATGPGPGVDRDRSQRRACGARHPRRCPRRHRARSVPPLGWPSTTNACAPRSSPGSPICAHPERASWRPPTPHAGDSNVTSTTAPSSACWRRRSSSAWRASAVER